jgi:hypothetical protein
MLRPLAVAAGALALTASAAPAATLTPDRPCYAAGTAVTLTAAAFAPGPVALTGFAAGTTTADETGAFAVNASAPRPAGTAPRAYPVTASDGAGQQATATVRVVRQRAWTNAPVSGTPTQRVTWRFAGFFTPGAAIYAHVRVGGRTVTTHRFGVPRGACGTLTARAARVPLRRASLLRAGTWQIKLDQARTYRASTPGRVLTFRVARG